MLNDKQLISIAGQKKWVTKKAQSALPKLTLKVFQHVEGAEGVGAGTDAGSDETLIGSMTITPNVSGGKPTVNYADGLQVEHPNDSGYVEWDFPENDTDAAKLNADKRPITWTYRISNLPRVNQQGTPYAYRIVEVVDDTDFAKLLESTDGENHNPVTGNITGANFTNTEQTKVKVKKVWMVDGKQVNYEPGNSIFPESITIRIYQCEMDGNDVKKATELVDRAITLPTEKGEWQAVVENLPAMSPDMNPYKYYFVEDGITNGWPWTATYGQEDASGEVISSGEPMGSQVKVANTEEGTVVVTNATWTKPLPNTGGTGTLPLVIAGFALIALAAALLRRRHVAG